MPTAMLRALHIGLGVVKPIDNEFTN